MSDDEKYAELGRVIRDLTDALAAQRERADRAEREREHARKVGNRLAGWTGSGCPPWSMYDDPAKAPDLGAQCASAQARAAEMEKEIAQLRQGIARCAHDLDLADEPATATDLRALLSPSPSARPAAEAAPSPTDGACKTCGDKGFIYHESVSPIPYEMPCPTCSPANGSKP